MDEKPTLSTKDAADVLGVSPRTVLNLVTKKRLPSFIIMKGLRPVLRYRQSDIQAFKDEQSRIIDELVAEIERMPTHLDRSEEDDATIHL